MASQDSKARAAGVAETDESNARLAVCVTLPSRATHGLPTDAGGRVAIDLAAYRLKSP